MLIRARTLAIQSTRDCSPTRLRPIAGLRKAIRKVLPSSTRLNNEPHRRVDADRDGRPNCSASGVADRRQLLTKEPAGSRRRAIEELFRKAREARDQFPYKARAASHAAIEAPSSSSLPRAIRASSQSLASAGTRTEYTTKRGSSSSMQVMLTCCSMPANRSIEAL